MGERFGRFLVHESLPASDIATVHRAELALNGGQVMQIMLGRLRRHLTTDQEVTAAFVREGQLGMYLQHPNVIRTFELGNQEGTVFVAMELVQGKSLAELLVEGMAANRPIPVPIAIAILRQICDALEYAHGLTDAARLPLGIVHGALSPSTIMVTDDGIVKLTAFGRAPLRRAVTGYTAPELVVTGVQDSRADLFALGVVAHEMLANHPLFTGADAATTLARLHTLEIPLLGAPGTPGTNDGVPPDIDGILRSALARDPAYRWQYAGQLRDGLVAVARQHGLEIGPAEIGAWLKTTAAPPPPPPPPPPGDLYDDEATQIRELDPAILALAAAAGRPQDLTAAPPPPAPMLAPAPEPIPEPPPPPAPPPRAAFEPEMGPEPTQIGAMPLITFGDTPLTALVGERGHARPSAPSVMPIATGISLPDASGPKKRSKLPLMIAIAAVIAIVVIIVLASS